ncbi:MAG: arp [Rickettsiaceae bacterium]|jgi:hypothetical protein|nr:arp [Rickettsiaceae bacterium]
MEIDYSKLTSINGAYFTNDELKYMYTHQNEVIEFIKNNEDNLNLRATILNSLHARLNKVVLSIIQDHKELLEVKDNEGSTPLIVAAASGNYTIVSKLVDLGADRDAVNKYKQGVLHHLCSSQPSSNKDSKLLKIATKKAMTYQNVNQQDEDGFSPIFSAIVREDLEIVQEYIKYKPNLDLRAKNGHTPFYFASMKLQEHSLQIDKRTSWADSEHPVTVINRLIAQNAKMKFYVAPGVFPEMDTTKSEDEPIHLPYKEISSVHYALSEANATPILLGLEDKISDINIGE